VYIDFDRIEAITGSRCNNHATSSRASRTTDGVASQENSPMTAGDGEFSMGDAPDSQVHNEVDRMLEQAEALEVDMNFQDWLDLDDYSD
jgi:hypothetical protein